MYTKGDWKAVEDLDNNFRITTHPNLVIARIQRRQHYRANAQLIASAPAQNKALIKAREDINWMLNNRQFLNPEVFDYIDEALAKVEEVK